MHGVVPYPLIGATFPSQAWGISQPQAWGDEITNFEMATRVQLNEQMFYLGFNQPWPSSVGRIAASGRCPMMTLVPTTSANTCDSASILAGTYDAQIQQWARYWNGSGIIRFAHEMNLAYSTAQPWNGMPAATYISLWNYVRSVWQTAETASGKPHAPWLWCPNLSTNGQRPFVSYFPGDNNVEYVGLDGYSYSQIGWPSFSSLYDTDLTALSGLTSKPQIVGEVGCSNDLSDSNRAAWINGMFDYFIARPNIKGFNWFEHSGTNGVSTGNSMLEGFPLALQAFRSGVARWAGTVA